MNAKQYARYEASVAHFFEQEGIQNLSCDENCEEHFSWSECDCCYSGLGGTRHDATGYNPTTGEIQHYSVCEDCIYYAENGQLDDQTMLDVERSE